MKIRKDFVTNSSSSSFIILSKVDRTPELDKYMLEEYGKYGVRLMDELLIDGDSLSSALNDYGMTIGEDDDEYYCIDELQDIDLAGQWLISTFYTYTTEGAENGDDAWLLRHLPPSFVTKVYESEED